MITTCSHKQTRLFELLARVVEMVGSSQVEDRPIEYIYYYFFIIIIIVIIIIIIIHFLPKNNLISLTVETKQCNAQWANHGAMSLCHFVT